MDARGRLLQALLGCTLVLVALASDKRCFPKEFMLGTATAAWQVEGGVTAYGKSQSVWDAFCLEQDMQCADVADDFIHRYKQDIRLMTEMGLSSFRFSISWPRVMTWDAHEGEMVANPKGIAFYHSLINALKKNNIEPILTLYHWDLPLQLETQLSPGGWLNRDMIRHFDTYAALIFHQFGRKVDFWVTFNEPLSFIGGGYANGGSPPNITGSDSSAYQAAHNVLLAHAKAVETFRRFQRKHKVHQHARISMVLNHDYAYPLDAADPMDVAAADRRQVFGLGWFLHPIVHGDYPRLMRDIVGSRLPTFSEEEQKMLQGSYDLLTLNHYSSYLVTDCSSHKSIISCDDLNVGWSRDMAIDQNHMPMGARRSAMRPDGSYIIPTSYYYPPGYLDTIRYVHQYDPLAPILLTENGYCGNETIENEDQLWYFQQYLTQVHKALTEEHIPIIGYTAWSFLDNNEWGSYDPRFGLFYVDTPAQNESHDLSRVPRTAAKWYSQVARSKCLEDSHSRALAIPKSPSPSAIYMSTALICGIGSMLVVASVVLASSWRQRHIAFRRSRQSEATPLLSEERQSD